VLEGVRRGAEELGVDLVLLRFGEDWRNECQGYLYVNPFEDQLARPPRFVGRARSALGNTNVSGTVSAGGTPVMVVGARFDHPNVSVVDTDNAALARDAVMHLAELGHRRIALVGGGAGSHQMSNTLDRSRGFAEGVRDSGLSVDPRHIIAATSWRLEDQGRQQLAAMLAMPPAQRPTAVFAAGYYFALDVYEAAATAGLRIPDDLSVVGVDDPPSAPHLSPPLTTMRQPLGQMGRLAARGLFDQVGESRPTVQTTLLKAELVVRRSTGPATTA
jgi:DNA-binding LacI/PurR family transcriptional regulator